MQWSSMTGKTSNPLSPFGNSFSETRRFFHFFGLCILNIPTCCQLSMMILKVNWDLLNSKNTKIQSGLANRSLVARAWASSSAVTSLLTSSLFRQPITTSAMILWQKQNSVNQYTRQRHRLLRLRKESFKLVPGWLQDSLLQSFSGKVRRAITLRTPTHSLFTSLKETQTTKKSRGETLKIRPI